MNLWLRIFWLLLAAPWRQRINVRSEAGRLTFRVLPTDIDLNLHMNNGRYLSIMDLGRLDLLLRSGLWRPMWSNRWTPILTTIAIRYRRELGVFRRFTVETRLAHWSGSMSVFEQTFILAPRRGPPVVAARALTKASFYDRRDGAFVPASRVAAAMNASGESPEATEEIKAFLKGDEALKHQMVKFAGQGAPAD